MTPQVPLAPICCMLNTGFNEEPCAAPCEETGVSVGQREEPFLIHTHTQCRCRAPSFVIHYLLKHASPLAAVASPLWWSDRWPRVLPHPYTKSAHTIFTNIFSFYILPFILCLEVLFKTSKIVFWLKTDKFCEI